MVVRHAGDSERTCHWRLLSTANAHLDVERTYVVAADVCFQFKVCWHIAERSYNNRME